MINPILEFILQAGIHFNPEITTPDKVMQSILNELNTVGSGITAWTSNGIIKVELEEMEQTAAQILIKESTVVISPSVDLKADPRATVIAFATISAVEQLHSIES